MFPRFEFFAAGRRSPSFDASDEDGRLERVRSLLGVSLLLLSELRLSVLGFSDSVRSERVDSEDLFGDCLGL